MVDLPTGLYEELVTRRLARRLHALDAELIDRAALDSTDAHELFARHVEQLMRRALRAIGSDDPKATARQVELTNEIAQAIATHAPGAATTNDLVADSRELLHALTEHSGAPGPARFPPRPEIPLASSALLVNGRDQPRIGNEIQRELASADAVDYFALL